MSDMAGYSSRSTVEKLGIKHGTRIEIVGAPADYATIVGRLPGGVKQSGGGYYGFIHVFATSKQDLKKAVLRRLARLSPEGALWISWPKRGSRVMSELDENIVREFGLARGLVDVKVCAIDETWSGLKFVRRLVDRPRPVFRRR